MKIVGQRSNSDIDVQFLDEHKYIYKHNTYANFKNRCIKNPYDKSMLGIGYLGVGEYKTWNNKHQTPAYLPWKAMIARCYQEKSKIEHKAYYDICSICDEWLDFQNFANWFYENWYEVDGRLHVDKDILYPGNHVYSPDTCLLVPQRINMLFVNKPNDRGLPNGIEKIKHGYSARYNGHQLGICKTLNEAYSLYSYNKELAIKTIAEEYKNLIPNKVYEALLKFKVRIENDKNYHPL